MIMEAIDSGLEGKIKLNSGMSFFIPVPISLVKAGLGIGNYFTSISKNYVSDEQRKNLEIVDLNALKKGMDVLKDYKGLKMLELKSKDGTEVRIVI